MSIKTHIPNSLTLLNLFAGCMGILFIVLGKPELVVACFVISMLADFLDGLVARWLKVSSPIGAQLDSLADMVSFGVQPALLMLAMILEAFSTDLKPMPFIYQLTEAYYNDIHVFVLSATAFLIALFAALRLAKFNVSDDQSVEFKGLATPAATALVFGLYMGASFQGIHYSVAILHLVTLLVCVLLVSNVPMFSFKWKSFGWKDAGWHYVFIILTFLSLIIFKFVGVTIAVALYVGLNFIRYFKNKHSNV